MNDFSKLKAGNSPNLDFQSDSNQASNPLSTTISESNLALDNYSQSLPRSTFDNDMALLLEVVRILNNMAPIRMPVYNFNIEEINGERYFTPDGKLLLIREYDSDIIRDHYVSKENPNVISRILEHDKNSGRLKVKIEPNTRTGSRSKTNITIFDSEKKYTLIQIGEEGIVNNITEFSGNGKSFQTLYRNVKNFKPARYLEGKDREGKGFEMVDCIFDDSGNIARIKRYSKKREINIEYTDDRKNITVKTVQK